MTQDNFCDKCYADLFEGYEHNCNPNQEVLKTVGQE